MTGQIVICNDSASQLEIAAPTTNMNKSNYKIKTESHAGVAGSTVASTTTTSLATEARRRSQDVTVCTDRGCAAPPTMQEECYAELEQTRKENHYASKRLGKLRDLRRELHVSQKVHDPSAKCQVGITDFISYGTGIEALSAAANVDIPDWILSEIEAILCLFTSLSGQSTTEGALATVMLWVKTHFSQSMCKTVAVYLKELFTSDADTQVGCLEETPAWLRAVRDARMNWHMCRNNKAFGQMSKLLGLLVTMGLCKASSLEFKLNEFVFFTPKIFDKHASAFDLMDATFETVLFFVEGFYLCFTTRSLKPLLVSDHTALQLDEEYARIMSWWDLVKVGNLQRVLNTSDQEFERRLNELSLNLKNLTNTLTGFDKKLVTDKFERILKMQNDFVTMKIASGVRHAPFAIEVFGESSLGKTTFLDQLLDALCVSAGLPLGKQYRAAYNAGDKFMSNWTTDKTTLIFDDIANEKSNFVERPPTRAVLDVINNQMYYANKAELEAKGKCFVEPWLVAASTNKKDMDAYLYSNCPYSIQRRFIVVNIFVKEEFKRYVDGVDCGIDSTKVREYYTVNGEYVPPPFDDVWELTIEAAVKPPKLTQTANYKIVEWNGVKMERINMATMIQWACFHFKEHRDNQRALLDGMRARETQIEKCPTEGCPNIRGFCSEHDGDHTHCPHCNHICDSGRCTHCENASSDDMWEEAGCQFGTKTTVALGLIKAIASKRMPNVALWQERTDDKAAEVVYKVGRHFINKFEWTSLIPAPLFNNMYDAPEDSWQREIYRFLYQDVLEQSYQFRTQSVRGLTWIFAIYWLLYLSIIGYWYISYIPGLLMWWMYLNYVKGLRLAIERDLLEYLRHKTLNVSRVVKVVRSDTVKYLCAGGLGIASLYALACWWRESNADKKKEVQGSLAPVTAKEVAARDAEKNVWTPVCARPLPMTELSKTVMPSVLQGVIEKNLHCCHIDINGPAPGQMNCLFTRSNVVLVPSHYFDKYGDSLNCSLFSHEPYKCGGKFAVRLERKSSYHIPGTDIMMCYSPNGGSFRDITKHFPTGRADNVNFHMTYRHNDGTILKAQGNAIGVKVAVTDGKLYEYDGYKYYDTINIDTFQGLCGAVLHSETQGSVILGLHLAGVTGLPKGFAGTITQAQLEKGYEELRKIEGVLLTGNAEKFETQVLGKTVVNPDAKPHPKSPLNFMPHESQVQYFGSCPGMSTSKSDVKVTPISEHITDVCGVPNIYGPPKMKPEWYGWQKCLSNLSIPAHPYEYWLLEQAVHDYKWDLLAVFKSKLWCKTRPLSDLENISGIPGCKFVDAIKLGTSIGYPLSGEKRKYVYVATTQEELWEWYMTYGGEPTEQEMDRLKLEHGHSFQVVKFIPDISEEIVRIEDCYRRGERGYPIAKACKKDEILTKEKCRIFYGNAIALTFLIRKYYLPLLRVLQMNPLVSECAVGINSHGPEWEEFHQHVTQFGMDRLIGGDYGKYDQKLPSQVIIAALRILIDCAEVCDYTKEDLKIMETMVGDIVYSVIAFNGDLIGLTEGTHISGNSLTVTINGICGSLNLRCYFFSHPDNAGKRFRDNVALSTYGDDNIGSVSPEQHHFTIKGASEFLGKYGQTYTMPDKESELLDFLPKDQFEFLKRKSVYHPALGVHIGALIDESCFKMLHCFMRGKGSPHTEEVASAMNIDTALSEWFNHGETVYEERRSQMQEVAKRASIEMYCNNLDKSYATKVKEWEETYRR